ncbi:MAG: tetratricopeptide repeat protein [Cyanobacteria bacterium SZAS-4]|nr:tetratricopeptide repeat protein [Cyanobacteria bacterium SZAS-4]
MQWNILIDEAQAACETNDLRLAQDKLVEALAYLEKFPQGDVFLVETLRPLTEILWSSGDDDLCLEYLVQQLHAEERLHGMGSLETNLSLTRLSESHFKASHFVEAEAYGRKSFFILQKAYGDDNLDVAIAGHILAVLHQAAGSYEASERMYKRSLSSLTRLRADQGEVTSTLANYASLLRLLHRDEEADHLLKCSASAA